MIESPTVSTKALLREMDSEQLLEFIDCAKDLEGSKDLIEYAKRLLNELNKAA